MPPSRGRWPRWWTEFLEVSTSTLRGTLYYGRRVTKRCCPAGGSSRWQSKELSAVSRASDTQLVPAIFITIRILGGWTIFALHTRRDPPSVRHSGTAFPPLGISTRAITVLARSQLNLPPSHRSTSASNGTSSVGSPPSPETVGVSPNTTVFLGVGFARRRLDLVVAAIPTTPFDTGTQHRYTQQYP